MEFDNVLTVVQGTLLSLQKTLKIKLKDIGPDDEETVIKIADTLESTLNEMNLTKDNYKCIHFALALNSVSSHLFEEDLMLCHLIVLPPLSPYLYLELAWRLNLAEFVGQVVLHCPEILVRDLLEVYAEHMKVIGAEEVVVFFQTLLINLLRRILSVQNQCKHRATEFVKLFKTLSKFDLNELYDEVEDETRKHCYWGRVCRMLFHLTQNCIEILEKDTIEVDPIYGSNLEFDYGVWPASSVESNWGHHCLGIMSSKALAALENINVDMYMSWTEEDAAELMPKMLQTSVRESAYTLRQAIINAAHLHNVVSDLSTLEKRLDTIALRPITEDEEIEKADADTILINLLNPKRTHVKWLRRLVLIGVFESARHMKVIAENARLMDGPTVLLLMDKADHYISNSSVSPEDLEFIHDTVFSCLHSLPFPEQIRVAQQFLQKQSRSLTSHHYSEKLIKLFNNVTSSVDDDVRNQLIRLAVEDCDTLVCRALNESLSSKEKSNLVIPLLGRISQLLTSSDQSSSRVISQTNTLMNSVKTQSEHIRDNFVHTCELLGENGLIDPNTFLNTYVWPVLETSLSEHDWHSTIFYLDVLSALTKVLKLKTTPYITFLSKTLNKIRPKVRSYRTEAVEVTNTIINLLEVSVNHLVHGKIQEDDEITWLRSLGARLSPLTWQYLLPLWTTYGKEPPQPLESALPWKVEGLGKGNELASLSHNCRASLVTSLVKVLPSLTMKEWEKIGGTTNLELTICTFTVLSDCILILFQLPFVVEDLVCSSHLLTNFMQFTKVNLIERIRGSRGKHDGTSVLRKFSQLMDELPRNLVESHSSHLFHIKQSLDSILL